MPQRTHPGAIRVNPTTLRDIDSGDFSVTDNQDNNCNGSGRILSSSDDDGVIRRSRKSSIFVTALEARLVEEDDDSSTSSDRQQLVSPEAPVVATAVPINVDLLEKLRYLEQQGVKDDDVDHNIIVGSKNMKTEFIISRQRRFYQWIGLLCICLTAIIVLGSTLMIQRRRRNSSSRISGQSSSADNAPYYGNWSVHHHGFKQITQHVVMIYFHKDQCDAFETDSVPNLYYTIQGGPNQTSEVTLRESNSESGGVDSSLQPPTAAIDLEASSQKGSCIRTQVNVLMCNATFYDIETKMGTIFTCATAVATTNHAGAANDTTDEDDVSLIPLVQVHIHSVTGLGCRMNDTSSNTIKHEQIVTTSDTIDMASYDAKNYRNVLWTSLNRFCGGVITDVIEANPSSCGKDNDLINVHDTYSNWSFCSSSNDEVIAPVENDDNNRTTITVPAMTAIDWNSNKNCPYMENYSPPNVVLYFAAASGILSKLSNTP
jgi:hypothetical protein